MREESKKSQRKTRDRAPWRRTSGRSCDKNSATSSATWRPASSSSSSLSSTQLTASQPISLCSTAPDHSTGSQISGSSTAPQSNAPRASERGQLLAPLESGRERGREEAKPQKLLPPHDTMCSHPAPFICRCSLLLWDFVQTGDIISQLSLEEA